MAMFGSLGFPELIFIFLLALLIFGPKKLPELGRTLGKAMAEFRKATTDLKRTINAELIEQELREADPRKIVRDSLREAKASLENAVRLDDERDEARKTAAAATARAAAAFADVVDEPLPPDPADPAALRSDPSDPTDPAGLPTEPAEPADLRNAPPEIRHPFEPAGAVARGAGFAEEDEEEEPPPKAPQPATTS